MSICGPCGDVHPTGTRICPVTQDPVDQPGPCGTRIDRYDVLRFLGGGGMGAVYVARHAMLGHGVALKLLRSGMSHDPMLTQRFMREAQAAASIPSAHIVKVGDFGVADGTGQPFLVMELLEGTDLEHLIRAERFLMPDRAVNLTLQILDGLVAAHSLGIVHRDMKPPNVFVVRGPDGGDFAKIVDFGISKTKRAMGDAHLTRTGVVMGTPHYMSPEQFKGARDVDARGDIYAVAVMLYRMVCGRLPHDGETYEQIVLSACTEDVVPVRSLAPYVSEDLARVIELGLERNAGARWQTADIFRRSLLEAATQGLIDQGHRGPILGPPPPPPRPPTVYTGESGFGAPPAGPPSWGSGPVPAPGAAASYASPVRPPAPASAPRGRGGMPLWIPLVAGGALLLGGGAFGATVWLLPDDEDAMQASLGNAGGGVGNPPLAQSPQGPSAPTGALYPAAALTPMAPMPRPAPMPSPAPFVPSPVAQPRPIPAPSPPPAPAPAEQGPRIQARSIRLDIEITGITLESSERNIREAFNAARPAMERCRDGDEHNFRVSVHMPSGGRIQLASSPYRAPAANCVVAAIRATSPVRVVDPDASGIVTVQVVLPAR